MRAAVEEAIRTFGTIHGVIHAAGRPDSDAQTTISETGIKEATWHFIPKVYGIYVLEKVFSSISLDFCLMTSSLSPMLGGLAHVAYASSNAFLDAYTAHNSRLSRKGLPAICINWEAWHNHEEIFDSYGIGATLSSYFITPEQGKQIFERFASYPDLVQVIVSTGSFDARLEQWTAIGKREHEGNSATLDHVVRRSRPKTKTALVEPSNEMEAAMAALWSDLLGIEPIGVYDNFFIDLGGHSLLGTQLISRLREMYQIDIPLRSLFEAPTIAQLSELIVRKLVRKIDMSLLDQIEELSEEAVEQLLAAGSERPGGTCD
jgi:acyl carrier protein